MKKKQPAPVEESTFWLELDERDVQTLNSGMVPQGVLEATESFLAWMRSPAEGIAHDQACLRAARKVAQ